MTESSGSDRLHEHVVAEQLCETMLERIESGEIDDLCYVYENCDELKRLMDVTLREMMEAAEREMEAWKRAES